MYIFSKSIESIATENICGKELSRMSQCGVCNPFEGIRSYTLCDALKCREITLFGRNGILVCFYIYSNTSILDHWGVVNIKMQN